MTLIRLPEDNLTSIARDIREDLRKHPDGGEHRVELPNGDVMSLHIDPSPVRTEWIVRAILPDGQRITETVDRQRFLRILPQFLRLCTKTRPVVQL